MSIFDYNPRKTLLKKTGDSRIGAARFIDCCEEKRIKCSIYKGTRWVIFCDSCGRCTLPQDNLIECYIQWNLACSERTKIHEHILFYGRDILINCTECEQNAMEIIFCEDDMRRCWFRCLYCNRTTPRRIHQIFLMRDWNRKLTS